MILQDVMARKVDEISQLSVTDNVPHCEKDFTTIFTENKPAVIAQLHQRSRSGGDFTAKFVIPEIINRYHQGGADAIALVTDYGLFGGSFAQLQEVRTLTDKPILCKDFIIDKVQIQHARRAGADACLLIVGILDDDKQMLTLKNYIEELGMCAVIEVFSEAELERALKVNPQVIAINNRDLRDMTVIKDNAAILAPHIPDSIHVIAASGVDKPEEVQALNESIAGVLIGNALMRSDDAEAFLRACRD